MKICYAKYCNNPIDIEAIIHHHADNEKCDPHDNQTHCYFELCKKHYKAMHKHGEDKLILKDKYYDK